MGKRLILIDDLSQDIVMFRGLLRKWGLVDYEVISNDHLLRPVDNTEAAREAFLGTIEEFTYRSVDGRTEAIFLDIWFDLDSDSEPLGYSIGKRLRAKLPKVPIILLTIEDARRELEAFSFNYDGFISKGDFRSWRDPSNFELEIRLAQRKREQVLDELHLLVHAHGAAGEPNANFSNPVILHISDIHYDLASGGGDAYEGMLAPLVRDLREGLRDEDIPMPNILVVSGDITHKGSIERYDSATEFLTALCRELNLESRDRAIIVPGNHDILRRIAELANPVAPHDHDPSLGLFRFAPFKRFFDEFYLGSMVYQLRENQMYSIFDLSLAHRLVVVGFNSCEVIDHVETKRGFVALDTVRNALVKLGQRDLAAPDILKIAVWHHPNLYETPDDPSFHQELLSVLSNAGFQLVLHGHIHRPLLQAAESQRAEGIFQFGVGTIAAAAGKPADWPRHYEIIALDLEGRQGTIYSRQRMGNRWIPFSQFRGGRSSFNFRLRNSNS